MERDPHLVFGTESSESKRQISIPYHKRDTHMHVVGTTGQGKSRFIQSLIEQDIDHDKGFCLIDPHGELSDSLVLVLANNPLKAYKKPIRFINVCDKNWVFNLNPLHITDPEHAPYAAGVVSEAITRVYGGDDAKNTPLIEATMFSVCAILAERGLPLAAAQAFFNRKYHDTRDGLIARVKEDHIRDLGEQLQDLNPKEYSEVIASTERRLRKFWSFPALRDIFSQTENPIDFRQAMDNGEMLVFNLSPRDKRYDLPAARMLGIVLVQMLFGSAMERDPLKKPRPFHLYIDEVQNFISKDITDMLSQTRKYGLFLTLSHQYFSQLREAGEHVPTGVHENTPLKAYFRMSHESAMSVVDDIFGDQVNPNRTKDIQTPVVTGHKREKFKTSGKTRGITEASSSSEGQAVGESEGHQLGSASGSATGSGLSTGISLTGSGVDGMDLITTELAGNSISSGSSHSDFEGYNTAKSYIQNKADSVASASSESQSESFSEGLVPIIEMLKTQGMGLEEQRYQLANRISKLGLREGYLHAQGYGSLRFYTLEASVPELPAVIVENYLKKNASEFLHLTPIGESQDEFRKLVERKRDDSSDFGPEND